MSARHWRVHVLYKGDTLMKFQWTVIDLLIKNYIWKYGILCKYTQPKNMHNLFNFLMIMQEKIAGFLAEFGHWSPMFILLVHALRCLWNCVKSRSFFLFTDSEVVLFFFFLKILFWLIDTFSKFCILEYCFLCKMELGHRACIYQKHIEPRVVGFFEPHPDA